MECQKKEKNHVELSEGNYRKNGSPPMGRFSTTGGGGGFFGALNYRGGPFGKSRISSLEFQRWGRGRSHNRRSSSKRVIRGR